MKWHLNSTKGNTHTHKHVKTVTLEFCTQNKQTNKQTISKMILYDFSDNQALREFTVWRCELKEISKWIPPTENDWHPINLDYTQNGQCLFF